MNPFISLIITSIGFGIGLAMDAFSVSLANGLNEPKMKKCKMLVVAGIFALFQGVMPMLGWVCVHTILEFFGAFQKFIPWIALALLSFIGGKMIYESVKNNEEECVSCKLSLWALLVQGVGTSIDALSVGLDIGSYDVWSALLSSAIIAVVTFAICFAGIVIGKLSGTKLAGKAGILGGVILIIIGLTIFIKGII